MTYETHAEDTLINLQEVIEGHREQGDIDAVAALLGYARHLGYEDFADTYELIMLA